jgi:hypothetical protein
MPGEKWLVCAPDKNRTGRVALLMPVFAWLVSVSLSGCSDTDQGQYADVHERNFATVMDEGAQHSATLKSFFDSRNPVEAYEFFKKKFPNCCQYWSEAAYNSPKRVESDTDKIFSDIMSPFISPWYVYTIDVENEKYFIGMMCNLEERCTKM